MNLRNVLPVVGFQIIFIISFVTFLNTESPSSSTRQVRQQMADVSPKDSIRQLEIVLRRQFRLK